MKIDVHNHFMPETLIEYIHKNGRKINTEIVDKDGKTFIKHAEGFAYPLFPEFYDLEKKTEALKAMGLDQAVLSVTPTMFYYWVGADAALGVAEICNDWVSEAAAADPEHFKGMATVPMQDAPTALKELIRAHEKLGLNALEIGSVINGKNLDEKEFFPIYEYCNAENIMIMLHPYYVGTTPQYERYYNINISAGVFETSMAINSLIFGGVFKEFPNLKVLASHGGGAFPYQFGRMVHGHKARPEPKVNITESPKTYVDRVYYDTITHWSPALQFLADNFGAEHIVIGTDYPFDMADTEPLKTVGQLKLTSDERKKIYSENIMSLI